MKRVSKRSSSPNGWQGYFARPIHVQNGPRFVTLEDARSYILGLPKEKQGGFWDPAIRSLLKAADTGDSGDIAHAKTSIEVAFMIQGQLTGWAERVIGPRRDQSTGTENQTVRWYSVPRYRFNIRDHEDFDDEDGMILPDDGTAREHAINIMGELQKDDEASWAGHTMEVMREGRVVWRIPFDRPSLPT